MKREPDMDTQETRDYSVLEGLDHPVRPPGVSFFYSIGLLLVTGVMVALPLIYVGVVAAAGYGLYWHTFHNFTAIMGTGSGNGRVYLFKLLVYATPIVVGTVVVFFLIKPLFAGRPRHAQPLALNPGAEPVLFAFIAQLCKVVGAPMPKRIDLDCQLNASAGFRRGLLSFLGSDLVLTIGLPLAANLTTRELAGVIAHEFGHFTQSLGMRLSYVIRSVNHWFARVVYERDAWDATLEEWSSDAGDIRIAIVLGIARLGVWCSRLLLHLLMLFGHLVSSFMLRQMEYNADAYEIKVSGSEVFERTTNKLATLNVALQATYRGVASMWETSRQLPDSFPILLQHAHDQLPAKVRNEVESTLGLQRTSAFATHPTPADRIRQARRAQDPGIYFDDRPATELFESFEFPARQVTLLHYTDDLGLPVTPQALRSIAREAPSKEARTEAGSSLESSIPACSPQTESFFLGILPLLKPLTLPAVTPVEDPDQAREQARQTAAQLESVTPQVAPMLDEFLRARDGLILARTAARLLASGAPVEPGLYGLGDATGEAAAAMAGTHEEQIDSLRHAMREVVPAVIHRLHSGLSIAATGGTPDGNDSDRINDLAVRLNKASSDYAAVLEIDEALRVTARLQTELGSTPDSPRIQQAVEEQIQHVIQAAKGVAQLSESASASPGLRIAAVAPGPTARQDSTLTRIQLQVRKLATDYYEQLDQLVANARRAETG